LYIIIVLLYAFHKNPRIIGFGGEGGIYTAAAHLPSFAICRGSDRPPKNSPRLFSLRWTPFRVRIPLAQKIKR